MSQSHGTALFREPANSGATSPLTFGKLINVPTPMTFDWEWPNVPDGLVFSGDANRTKRTAFGTAVVLASNTPRQDGYVYDKNGLLVPGWLLEGSSANLIRPSSDFTHSNWTKQTGVSVSAYTEADGSASNKIDWTGASVGTGMYNNNSVGVSSTTASTRAMDVRADVAGGTIGLWDAACGVGSPAVLTLTTSWQRVTYSQISSCAGATPWLVKRSDSPNVVYARYAQVEDGPFATSYVPTTTTTVTRAAELASVPWTLPPGLTSIYTKHIECGTVLVGAFTQLLALSDAVGSVPRFIVFASSGTYSSLHQTGGGSAFGPRPATAPGLGSTEELLNLIYGDGSLQIGQSIDGAAETLAAQSGALAFAGAWSGQYLFLNGAAAEAGGLNRGYAAFQSVRIATVPATLAQLQSGVLPPDPYRFTHAKTGTAVGSLVSDGHGGYVGTPGDFTGTGKVVFFGENAVAY